MLPLVKVAAALMESGVVVVGFLKVVGWPVRVVAAFLTSGFEERIGVEP